MAFAVFGPGSLYLTRTDIPNATPVNVGYAQEFSLDESAETKELYGSLKYPLAVGMGTIKATGKMKAAVISGQALNVFHGGTFSTSGIAASLGEAVSVPSAVGTATVSTVAGAFATEYNGDLGVVYGATGLPLIKSATSTLTGAGSYFVSAGGTYTFDEADAGASVLLNYAYNDTVSGAVQQIVQNQLIGTQVSFQIDYVTKFMNKTFYIRVYQAICTKLSHSFKLTDFNMPELDFSIFAAPSGNVYAASYADNG